MREVVDHYYIRFSRTVLWTIPGWNIDGEPEVRISVQEVTHYNFLQTTNSVLCSVPLLYIFSKITITINAIGF